MQDTAIINQDKERLQITTEDTMTQNQKNQMLDDAMFEQERGEFEGKCGEDYPKNYSGLFLHVNDHGNVTLYRSFKNGSLHEIASRV